GTSLEQLAALPAVWESEEQPAPDITAGNTSPMSDGASAMLIADRATAERLGLPIRARFVHFAVLADDPVLVLSAPNPVTRKLLERTGMKIDEFDAIECNEAFAAIALMWAKEFGPARLVVAPERGGRIMALSVDGLDLLVTPDVDDHNFGCFPMAPWAGRIRHGSFDFEGQRYQLPLNNPPHAIHGTARDHPWS